MAKRAINPAGLPTPVGPYSNVVSADAGRVVFCAGQVALDAGGSIVGEGDIVAQTRQVMENLKLALEAAGASFADVVKVTNYITDVAQFSKMAAVRQEYLREPYPASTLIEVQALMFPELLIEIEAVAVVTAGR
ncbi:MAG: RidA family protein [Solirubrobacterales bacterium]|nr:RidA family protein [Solirubrobacterales bacterium]